MSSQVVPVSSLYFPPSQTWRQTTSSSSFLYVRCISDRKKLKPQHQAQIESLRRALALKDERVRSLITEVTALKRDSDRARKNTKFDQAALEGQRKKVGILEHNVTTLRHDLQTSTERRSGGLPAKPRCSAFDTELLVDVFEQPTNGSMRLRWPGQSWRGKTVTWSVHGRRNGAFDCR